MSALDRVREKYKMLGNRTSKTCKSPSAGFAGPQAENLESSGSERRDGSIVNFDREKARRDVQQATDQREKRRQAVLAMMADAPKSQRYFMEAHTQGDYVILTWAIRGVATFEQSVLKDSFDAMKLLELLDAMK
jgi:hypothetical protein